MVACLRRWFLASAMLTLSSSLLGAETDAPTAQGTAPSPVKATADGRVQVFPAPALVVRHLVRPMRGTLMTDPVQNRMMASRDPLGWKPVVGETMLAADNAQASWLPLDEQASQQPLGKQWHGGYLYVTLEEPADRVAMLSGSGVGMFYINGEPHAGDLYHRGISPLPVKLCKGINHFLMLAFDDAPQVNLAPVSAEVTFSGRHTVPDLLVGECKEFAWAGIGVCNATEKPLRGLSIRATREGLPPLAQPMISVPPLTTLRVAYRIPPGEPASREPQKVLVELLAADGTTVLQTANLTLDVVDPHEPNRLYRQTMVSGIDGSVQYYAVKRALPHAGDPPPAMVLTLHGASVEAASHLIHISSKSWAHLVSPTNRGAYGFDWEDYGRKDALEALDDAQRRLPYDATRVYLSGHSMGGHGTWNIGSLRPDRFAAIGPSAGWISYWGYRGHAPFDGQSPIDAMLRRTMVSSDTERLIPNLRDRAVYVLHGNVDSNVPADQSRRMAELLKPFHHDWTYREEGGSHFWNSKESDSSTACVDWPEMMQCFARHALPPSAAVRSIEFVTPNPRVTSRLHWLTVHAQERHGELSQVKAECWPLKREFEAQTSNVEVLRFDTRHLLRADGNIVVRLDGKPVTASAPDSGGGIWFEKAGGEWHATSEPSAAGKGPHRYGPVKEEVDRNFVVVYGTHGEPAENAAMLAKARYDAETFLSRGNCSGEMLADIDFQPGQFKDRSVLLIGNADTNAAWPRLLESSPVTIRRGEIRLGERTFSGDDLAAMFVQPRRDSETASVIAVGGTGAVGIQLSYRWSLFVPFMRYPDCIVAQTGRASAAQPTTLAAGFFGRDWSVSKGQFAFYDSK